MDDRPYDIGIDVGSISTKVLILREGEEVVDRTKRATSMEPGKLAGRMVDELLRENGIRKEEVMHTVSTGQGRKSVDFADIQRTEITAFSKGAVHIDPDVEVVVDIGGQGIRIMKIGEMGIISDFRTNDKCSSGTGCFLDAMANALEVGVENSGKMAMGSDNPERVYNTCTVFAESEVVSLMAKGKSKQDILAGLNSMVARKIGAMINSVGSSGKVMAAGGGSNNTRVISGTRKVTQRDILVPEDPQYLGALGAARISTRNDSDRPVESGPGTERKKGLVGFLRRVLT